VRRFWTAVVGPSAVADLLRLIAAADMTTSIPLPRRTPLLLTAGLIVPRSVTYEGVIVGQE
jgi:hypothetical protein